MCIRSSRCSACGSPARATLAEDRPGEHVYVAVCIACGREGDEWTERHHPELASTDANEQEPVTGAGDVSPEKAARTAAAARVAARAALIQSVGAAWHARLSRYSARLTHYVLILALGAVPALSLFIAIVVPLLAGQP